LAPDALLQHQLPSIHQRHPIIPNFGIETQQTALPGPELRIKFYRDSSIDDMIC
jgi:hypothetical protein